MKIKSNHKNSVHLVVLHTYYIKKIDNLNISLLKMYTELKATETMDCKLMRSNWFITSQLTSFGDIL